MTESHKELTHTLREQRLKRVLLSRDRLPRARKTSVVAETNIVPQTTIVAETHDDGKEMDVMMRVRRIPHFRSVSTIAVIYPRPIR